MSKEVSIEELVPFISQSVVALRGRVGGTDPFYVIYQGEVNEDSNGPVEVAVPVDRPVEGGAEIPSGRVAFTVARGRQTRFPEIIGAYDAIASWVDRHGHRFRRSTS